MWSRKAMPKRVGLWAVTLGEFLSLLWNVDMATAHSHWLCAYTNLGYKGWHRARHLVITHTRVFPSLPWLPPALGSAKTHLALSSVLKIATLHLAVSWCEHASLITPLLPFLASDAQCPARWQTHKLTCLSVLICQGQRFKLLSRPVSPPAP